MGGFHRKGGPAAIRSGDAVTRGCAVRVLFRTPPASKCGGLLSPLEFLLCFLVPLAEVQLQTDFRYLHATSFELRSSD